MNSDEDDFVFYGTPIEREEDITTRKKKSVAEAAGQLRTLVPWQQEVRDEEGRRRFHGAFTGGYSAGYYNTVGSKEGWTPQTFTSSRKNRAETKEQSILNFLDDDEKEEMQGRSLATSALFDTFGFTAAEVARTQLENEQKKRPSAIPGPVPDELVLPASNSIGVKLLLKMGWRHGHSVKDSRANLLHDKRREARKAFLALSSDDAKPSVPQHEPNIIDEEGISEQSTDDVLCASKSTPVFVLNPKQDMHGLGFDPFKHAPEFRERKRLRLSGNQVLGSRGAFPKKEDIFASKSGKVGPGFGIGALEELDAEDEDVYASGYDFEETFVQDIEEPSTINKDIKLIKSKDDQGVLPGFRVALKLDFQLERFNAPVIPSGFKPQHKFPSSPENGNRLAGPPPTEVPHPEDKNLKLLIDGFAALVTRCGKLFEDLSREKNKTNPLFSFLSGGNGHDYYARRLWEEQQKQKDQSKPFVDIKPVPSVQKMTAESRGRILGERPLERSYSEVSNAPSTSSSDAIQLQYNLKDTFTKPASLGNTQEVVKPFKSDPAKQERFEQFLKEKYQGGLRSTESGGNNKMSESDRARERLDFEAAAEVIEKGKSDSNQQFAEISNLQFTSGGLVEMKVSKTEEPALSKMYPKREEYEWRPASILCKRFDISDPYLGKAPALPRARSRMDSLIFQSDFVKEKTKSEAILTSLPSKPEPELTTGVLSDETEKTHSENVERPVDLYKAIFSDDSDAEEEEVPTLSQMPDPEKTTDVANSTLNRLIAGDFLELMGKELGLEVPPEPAIASNKIITTSQKEIITTTKHTFKTPASSLSGPPKSKEVFQSTPSLPVTSLNVPPIQSSSSLPDMKDDNKMKSKQHRSRSSSPSSDDKRRRKKHSRRHRRRSSSPSSDTDASDDYRSGGKSGNRSKHKRHHRNRSDVSPSRSSRKRYDREDSEDRRSSRRSGERKSSSISHRDSRRRYD
ncbi:hypothetical protein ACHQM5_009072 [Ranunculus cassubicifolius]